MGVWEWGEQDQPPTLLGVESFTLSAEWVLLEHPWAFSPGECTLHWVGLVPTTLTVKAQPCLRWGQDC
jgi:hypothetical protein